MENFLGDEIFDIKHRSVKFKVNIIITTEFLNRYQQFGNMRHIENIR
jgi:hypothetical protein